MQGVGPKNGLVETGKNLVDFSNVVSIERKRQKYSIKSVDLAEQPRPVELNRLNLDLFEMNAQRSRDGGEWALHKGNDKPK